ncbi:BLUF domain-containing protein [Sphingomonas sp. A2-49]|uniref:BLUF domain-containing protein n=1 Tax=Sphingomonas sp. A2-49 TaxID=1391375 RepID=UPI0021D34D34|nr:BLUF domain-containing protein [Sphingomonas sp. A2-49]MCU6455268.1 BLUF domain-containing protein [Sphingomonas sp. A2-49]
MRQIFYHSRAVGRADVSAIMASSKRNNGMDGITGMLVFDGRTFMQVLEGPDDSVATTFARIQSDPRHTDVTVISDHTITERDFAYWSMELLDPGQPSDDALWRLRRRLEHFDRDLQHYFFDAPSD